MTFRRLFIFTFAIVVTVMIQAALAAQDAPTPVPTAAPLATFASPATALPIGEPTPDPAQPAEAPFDDATCGLAYESVWSAATEACIGRGVGFACNAGSAPLVEPAGALSNSFAVQGSLIEAGLIDLLHTPPLALETNTAGVAFIRPTSLNYAMLLIGDVEVRDVSPPEFPAWTNFIASTSATAPSCATAPSSTLILQADLGLNTRIVVNGISLLLGGTVLVRTDAEATRFAAMNGRSSAYAFGAEQPLLPGQQVSVSHAPDNVATPASAPSSPAPYEAAFIANLPVPLFDRPLQLPQPGVVTTQGAVNLRTEPNTNAAVIVQVASNEILSVLGANEDATWLHVRRETGETGWMFAELLASNLGTLNVRYQNTPLPPQRYGELGSRGQVSAPAGVSLRVGPDQLFPALGVVNDGQPVTLLARSPYSPWVKVDAGGTVGWIALITLQTQAVIDSLPVDYSAPGIPTPTTPPGSFGNAFPDPNEGG